MNTSELEVSRRLCDQVGVSYLGLRWTIHCYAVDRTLDAANRTAILTVLAIAASIALANE